MLDIRLLREKPDFIRERLATRGEDLPAQVDEILAIDAQRRRAETELQKFNVERNRLSKEIGMLRSRKEPSGDLEARVRVIAERIPQQSAEATAADEKQRDLLLNLPNLPHLQAPIGKSANDNPLVREWGEKPSFGFSPLGHVELATALKLIDFERAAKISGSGLVCFTNLGPWHPRSL